MFMMENCTSDEIENYIKVYNLKLDWWSQDPEENHCYKISKNNEVVAMIEFSTEVPGYICINNFEVFKKGHGYGRDIIKSLTSSKEEKYCLYSKNKDSDGFWESVGFILGDDGFGTPMFYSE